MAPRATALEWYSCPGAGAVSFVPLYTAAQLRECVGKNRAESLCICIICEINGCGFFLCCAGRSHRTFAITHHR